MRLDRTKFTRWLAAKPPAEIVGRNRSPSCPIANFYHEASGGCDVVIFEDTNYCHHMIDRGYDRRKMPAWASAFVYEVDGEDDGKITAGRALEVLNDLRG